MGLTVFIARILVHAASIECWEEGTVKNAMDAPFVRYATTASRTGRRVWAVLRLGLDAGVGFQWGFHLRAVRLFRFVVVVSRAADDHAQRGERRACHDSDDHAA